MPATQECVYGLSTRGYSSRIESRRAPLRDRRRCRRSAALFPPGAGSDLEYRSGVIRRTAGYLPPLALHRVRISFVRITGPAHKRRDPEVDFYGRKSDLPYIRACLDAPKTFDELQQNAGTGYDEHHIVEQWSKKDGIPQSLIDAPFNRVKSSTLKQWEINSWLGTRTSEFKDSNGKDMSPREYLKGKSWEERYRFGIGVLIRFGVLKP
jgi:hypothetical protein